MSLAPPPPQILIVEDDPTLRLLLQATLESVATVRTVSDGREALAALRQQAVELAIIDLHMPHMDGLTLCRELRADPAFQSLRIVVASSDDDAEQVRTLQALGVSAFVKKPYTPSQIRQLVSSLLTQ
jgi:two-component system chemotaxis response regulator CheY